MPQMSDYWNMTYKMAGPDEGNSKRKRLMIIDTDAGLDDAQAIVMALGYNDVHVVAITTVQGNVSANQVTKNVQRLLRLTNRTDVPVYQGCESPLLGVKHDATFYHGQDVFGDIPDIDERDHEALNGSTVPSEHAVNALVRIVKEHQGEISLVCLGPLTNVALALRMSPGFGKRLKDCFIMGGNYHGKGNTTTSAEFNFYADSDAAHMVLSELNCASPLTIACWEVCIDYSLPMEKYHQVWANNSTRLGKFFRAAEANAVLCFKELEENYYLADQVAMAAALDGTIVTESKLVRAEVELSGAKTRGQMVVDWKPKAGSNGSLILKIDIEKLYRLYHDALICLS